MDIGIDLGTTFSAVAVPGKIKLQSGYPEGEYLDECDVTIIPAPDHNPTFPSVIVINPEEPGQYLVGMEAKQAAESGASPIMFSKRKIGTSELLPIGADKITAKDAARQILKYLKQCAETALGEPVHRAVVTHPAYFDRSQVDETRIAAEEAGFEMAATEQMLMEPIAAALAFVRSDTRDPLRILIYDLGGGTFDVTVLERNMGVIEVKAYDGDHLLGGYNFDRKIAQWLLDRMVEKGHRFTYDETNEDDRSRRAQLLQWAESVKEKLASVGNRKKMPIQLSCSFLIDASGNKVQVKERITQEEFIELVQEELETTIECCRRALAKANIEVSALDYVLLVGGSTYGPWVEEKVREAFGIEPMQFRPDLCVAAGAAIQCLNLPRQVSGGGLRMLLDVSTRAILPTTGIYGRIQQVDGMSVAGLTVALHLPDGTSLGPVPLYEQGGFGFADVPLLDEGPTGFSLKVFDSNGGVCLEQAFEITYAPENTDVANISTVLPKPLYVKTASGMVPLAEEGIPLPSQEITIMLSRLFGGPTQEAEIFQEGMRVGAIAINEIPDEGGEGAKVVFSIQVTEKNEIKGTARVLSPRTNNIVCEGPILVTFPPVPIPESAVLKKQFQNLEQEMRERIEIVASAEQKTILIGKGGKLCNAIQNKLREQEPDRQELVRLLRDLDRIVNPPNEDMNPPKAHFDALVNECRSLIAQQKDNPALQRYDGIVTRCQQEGEAAYAAKDERKWSAIISSLDSLRRTLEPQQQAGSSQPQETPPTPVLKQFLLMEVNKLRGSLKQARDARLRESAAAFSGIWEPKCTAVADKLDETERQNHAIPDNMDKEQALGKIRVLLQPMALLEKDIANIQKGVTLDKA